MSARAERRPGRVYAILDTGRAPLARIPELAAEVAGAGVRTLQLRAKRLPDDRLWRLAEALLERLAGWPGEAWIDDRCDLAAALPFAGVHLGQTDLPPAAARPLVGAACAIGRSTHDAAQLAAADADAETDWVAIGPVFPTGSKERADPVLGLDALARLRRLTAKPLIAIGGIDAERLPAVLAAGADSAAVIAALLDGDVAANCRRLLAAAGEAG